MTLNNDKCKIGCLTLRLATYYHYIIQIVYFNIYCCVVPKRSVFVVLFLYAIPLQ